MIRPCPSCNTLNRIPPSRLHQTARCGKCQTPISPVNAPYVVDSREAFDDLVEHASLPILVDFWATWCGPCKTVAQELVKLARDKAGRVVVAKLDTDEIPDVASRYQIRSIPTLILFREGREANRVSGAMPAEAIARSFGL